MKPKKPDPEPVTSIITVPLTDNDHAVLEEIARMTGSSNVNVIYTALWHYARHLDARVPPGVFSTRRAAPVQHQARH